MRFEAEGRIEWAILAPASVDELRAIVWKLKAPYFDTRDEDEAQSWCVVRGHGKHAAVIETAPGSSGTEIDIAEALATKLKATVYAVGFVGYDDSDHGLPHITRYDPGKKGAPIWLAPYDTDDEDLPPLELVAGPKGIPCTNPFDFADALGCPLRSYFSAR